MANGKWDCCEVLRARPYQMHDELLRDDPKLNLGRKHASGGMLFHFRVDRSNSQTKRFDVSNTFRQLVAQVPGNQLLGKHPGSDSCSVLRQLDWAFSEARCLRISRTEVIGREEDALNICTGDDMRFHGFTERSQGAQDGFDPLAFCRPKT